MSDKEEKIVEALLQSARTVLDRKFASFDGGKQKAELVWAGLEPGLRMTAAAMVKEALARRAAAPAPAQSDERERLRDAFLAAYTQQLREAAREGRTAWPESQAEEVARKMVAAIEKQQSNWSPTLAKAAKDVGIKPNMTAVREALYGPLPAKMTGPEPEKEARKPDVSAAQAARRDALLDERVSHNGIPKTWRQIVEQGSERGRELGISFRTSPDLTRAAFNRMGNAEHDAWEKKQKEKGLKPVFTVGTGEDSSVEVNKTVFEYAMGLSRKPVSVSYDFGYLDGTAKAAAREATQLAHEALLRAVEAHNRKVSVGQQAPAKYAFLASYTQQEEGREEAPPPVLHRYGARNRPVGFATVPKGHVAIEEPPRNPNGPGVEPWARHGVVVYDRPLTPDEIRSYELAPYLPSEDVVKQAVALADEYGQEYADVLRDSEEHEINAFARQMLSLVNEGNYFTDASSKEMGEQIVEAILRKYPESPPAPVAPVAPAPVAPAPVAPVRAVAPAAPAATPAPSSSNVARRAEEWKALEKSEEWQEKRTPERIADFARRHPDFAPIAVENEKTIVTETRPFPYFGLSGGYKEITPIVRRGSTFVSKTKDGKFDVINASSSVVLGRFDLFANAQNFLEKLPDAFVASSPSAGSYAQSVREKDALLSREGGKKVYEPG